MSPKNANKLHVIYYVFDFKFNSRLFKIQKQTSILQRSYKTLTRSYAINTILSKGVSFFHRKTFKLNINVFDLNLNPDLSTHLHSHAQTTNISWITCEELIYVHLEPTTVNIK